MAAPGTGGLVVSWSQGVSGVNRLFFQHVAAEGTRTWSVSGVSPSGVILEQWNPVLEGTGEGELWIGWEEVRPGADPKVMLTRRGPPKGKAWDAGDLPLSNATGSQGRLTLSEDGHRGVLAAWIDNRTDVGLFLQRVDEKGQLQWGNGKEVATGLSHPQQPHIALAGYDRVAVVWLEEREPKVWELHHRVLKY